MAYNPGSRKVFAALLALILLFLPMSTVASASSVEAKKCSALTPFKSVSGLSLVDKNLGSGDCGPGEFREFLYAGKTNKGPTLVKALNSFRAAKSKSFLWSDSWLDRPVTNSRLTKNYPELCQLSEGAVGGTPRKLSSYLVDSIRSECAEIRLTLIDRKKKISSFVSMYPVEIYTASQYSSSSTLVVYVSVSWEFWE